MLSNQKYINLLMDISRKAGKEFLGEISTQAFTNSNISKDIKSSADLKSEKVILTELEKTSTYPILSEESGIIGKLKEDEPYWIVDPLDGTMNFTRNFPMACISIALWQKNEPLLGVVHDFTRHLVYSAMVGDIAKMNGEQITVSNTKEIEQSVLATGFPVKRNYTFVSLKKFIENIQKFKKIRMIGAAALSLAYVASGVFDAYYEEDIMIWDVAAGLALVKAAGGEIYIKPGSKKHSVICAATNGKIPIKELIV